MVVLDMSSESSSLVVTLSCFALFLFARSALLFGSVQGILARFDMSVLVVQQASCATTRLHDAAERNKCLLEHV